MTDNNETTAWNGVLGGDNAAPQAQCDKGSKAGLAVAALAAAVTGAAVITTGTIICGWRTAREIAEIARNQAKR